ncbi:MAG: porin family protein [Verrucomicrobia bacterium]|nr:porin family protein [Verrucomicrobiota bacterium]
MEKNILLLLISSLFCMAAHAQGQELYAKDISYADRTNSYFKILDTPVSLHNTANEENKSTARADAQTQAPSVKEKRCPDGMNFYTRIFGGVNFLQNTNTNGNKFSYEPGYVFAGSLGYSWRYYGLRVEAEYAFRRNAIKKIHFITQGSSANGHFQTSSYMANLLWDMPLCAWGCPRCKFIPFIGAGIGYDFKKVHSSNSRVDFHQKFNHFSWQAMAGVSYPIFRHAELSLEYKFHQGGCHFYNHALGLGLMYKFGFIK